MDPSALPSVAHASGRNRVQLACQECRERRKRCDGGWPCAPCTRFRRICLYTPVSHEENQTARRRKHLDPTYRKTDQPRSLVQPPPTNSRYAASSLVLDLESLAPPLWTRGPLSCPLPVTAPAGFFEETTGSDLYQAFQPAKPHLYLNATCSTYEEIGKAVLAQYEVVFVPKATGNAVPVPPLPPCTRSGFDLHNAADVLHSAAPNLCPPDRSTTRPADAQSPSCASLFGLPPEMAHSIEALCVHQAPNASESVVSAVQADAADYFRFRSTSSVSSAVPSCSLPSPSNVSRTFATSHTDPALGSASSTVMSHVSSVFPVSTGPALSQHWTGAVNSHVPTRPVGGTYWTYSGG